MTRINSVDFIKNAINKVIDSFNTGRDLLKQVGAVTQLIGLIGISLITGQKSVERRIIEPDRVEHLVQAQEHEINTIPRHNTNELPLEEEPENLPIVETTAELTHLTAPLATTVPIAEPTDNDLPVATPVPNHAPLITSHHNHNMSMLPPNFGIPTNIVHHWQQGQNPSDERNLPTTG